MRIATSTHSTLSTFRADTRGNFGIMFAAIAGMLALSAGFGINIAQLSLTRSNLLNALDSAVSSTARDLTTGRIAETDARGVIQAFLDANGGTGFVAADRIVLDKVSVDRSTGTVVASASVLVDLAFPLFGDPARRVSTQSAALYSDRKVEVAMMLDVTGSMAKNRTSDKIGDLKLAAGNAVKQLLSGNRPGNERTRVALVPYAEAVNVGALAGATVFVEQARGSDLPPPVEAPILAAAGSGPDTCATERKLSDGSADISDDAPDSLRRDAKGQTYRALVNRDDRLRDCPSATTVPLTADAASLLGAIDAFKASGYTAGGIAAQWGYYMLSPSWRGAIAAADMGAGPADYDPRKVAKVAILMSDGAFNTAFAGPANDPRGGETVRSPRHAQDICRRMKQDGIEIFTIGFALPAGESSAARSVLRNCASADTSSIKHFHEAANGDQLDRTFSEIVASVERLALTK